MVERVARLGDRSFDVVEMDEHAGHGIGLAVDRDAGAERMAVHPRVRMTWGRGRQQVGSLEEEFLIDTHGGGLGDFVLLGQGLGQA